MMFNRVDSLASPDQSFTEFEILVLDRTSRKKTVPESLPRTLSHYVMQLAKLGGDLTRKGDPPPGNTVMWRGKTRLTDIVLGMQLAQEIVGN